nr:MAG TPA: hypothetical protein [Caudoviricetes sp.]
MLILLQLAQLSQPPFLPHLGQELLHPIHIQLAIPQLQQHQRKNYLLQQILLLISFPRCKPQILLMEDKLQEV